MRDVAEVAAELRGFEGIGPFYAELVTVRALGHTDVLPATEPRVMAATAARLGRESLSPTRLRRGRRGLAAVAHLGLRRPPRRRLTSRAGVRPPDDWACTVRSVDDPATCGVRRGRRRG